jgi:hypothetical protein
VPFVRRSDDTLPFRARGERGKYRRNESDLFVRERQVLPERGERTLERIDEHREWHVRLELGRAPQQRLVAALIGTDQNLGDQRRLADAGLAGDVDGAVLASAERVEKQIKLRELSAAPNERSPRSGTRERQRRLLPGTDLSGGWVVRLGDAWVIQPIVGRRGAP